MNDRARREPRPYDPARAWQSPENLAEDILNTNHEGPAPQGNLGNDIYFDDVSGVYSRKYLFWVLGWELTHAHRIAVIFIDLDKFGKINKQLGQHEGNVILREAAQVLLKHAEWPGWVSRLGGDEFVLFLRKRSREQIMRAAEQIRQDVEGYAFSFDWRLTASIGIETRPEGTSSRTGDDLVRGANAAMRQAKDGGGNRVVEGDMA